MSVIRATRRHALSRCALASVLALGLSAVKPHLAMAYELEGLTTRVSVSSSGAQANNDSAKTADWGAPSVSEDGRYVVFTSAANNLVPGDTNNHLDVFRRDTLTGTTVLVSVETAGIGAPAGSPGNEDSKRPSVSADGQRVAFMSKASDLVGGDSNGMWDIFLRDITQGTTDRISLSYSGDQATGEPGAYGASSPSISADGQLVAYRTDATNAVGPLDANGSSPDVILYDAAGGQSTVSVTSAGNQVVDTSTVSVQSVSEDGRYVVFDSAASNLVPGDTNGAVDVFVHDMLNSTTARVSLDFVGGQLAAGGHAPSISADGKYVAFLALNDNVIVRKIDGSWAQRASGNGYGQAANRPCTSPTLSRTGQYVTFASDASNLSSDAAGSSPTVYIHNYFTSVCLPVSIDSYGNLPHGACTLPAISADGRHVAWSSVADDLVAGDTNKKADVFVRALDATATALPKAKSLSTPVAPSTMHKGHSATIYGFVAPRHTKGTYLATLQFFKKNSKGVWVYDHSVFAKRSTSYSTKTKYTAKTSLSSKGKWRVRALHSDSVHAPTFSKYDYITVK